MNLIFLLIAFIIGQSEGIWSEMENEVNENNSNSNNNYYQKSSNFVITAFFVITNLELLLFNF